VDLREGGVERLLTVRIHVLAFHQLQVRRRHDTCLHRLPRVQDRIGPISLLDLRCIPFVPVEQGVNENFLRFFRQSSVSTAYQEYGGHSKRDVQRIFRRPLAGTVTSTIRSPSFTRTPFRPSISSAPTPPNESRTFAATGLA